MSAETKIFSLRVPVADLDDWRKRAAASRQSLSAWVRLRVRSDAPSGVRYVSSNSRAGISITVTNDDRWQTWINAGWYIQSRKDPWCCKAGHERLEDAIDHGISILRGLLLAEKETWPADSIGAQLRKSGPAQPQGDER